MSEAAGWRSYDSSSYHHRVGSFLLVVYGLCRAIARGLLLNREIVGVLKVMLVVSWQLRAGLTYASRTRWPRGAIIVFEECDGHDAHTMGAFLFRKIV